MSIAAQNQTVQILIIDDEPDMVRIYSDMLRHVGYSVLSAHEGITALALARAYPPDIILLDILLPDVSGLELLPKFKALDPEVQVIMLTVLDEAVPAAQATRDGAFAYLIKSAHMDEVLKAVEQAWETRKAHTYACFEDLCLNLRTQQVFLNEQLVETTELEWRLLAYLSRHPEGAPYDTLWQDVWGDAPPADRDIIQRMVNTLRQKIGAEHLQTMRAYGCRLE
ncbi:MAG: response regulator transcription factor [Anaerolineae bacterium]|nr:response regulator transcription factor [Anaerolineae bacterium]